MSAAKTSTAPSLELALSSRSTAAWRLPHTGAMPPTAGVSHAIASTRKTFTSDSAARLLCPPRMSSLASSCGEIVEDVWPKRDSGTSPCAVGVDQASVRVSSTCTSSPPPMPPQMSSRWSTTPLVCRERGGGAMPVHGGWLHWCSWLSKTKSSLSSSALSPPPKMYSLPSIMSAVWPLRGDGAKPWRSGCIHVSAWVVFSSSWDTRLCWLPIVPTTSRATMYFRR